MISIEKVYQRTTQLLKTGTSGYQNDVEFTNDAYSAFISIKTTLCNNYEKNAEVSDLMNKDGLVITAPYVTNNAGLLPIPTNLWRTLTMRVNLSNDQYAPMKKLRQNQVAMYNTSPIRGFNTGQRNYGYTVSDKAFTIYPKRVNIIDLTYCITTALPLLVLTSDDDDYVTVDTAASKDILLPEDLFNLFCYKMVESSSMEMKESVAAQYAALGISKEQI